MTRDFNMKDYYAILGVARNATDAEIKTAYRSLTKIHHPDKGGDEDKFKEINEAYSTLGDVNKRGAYDTPPQQQPRFEDFFQHFGFSGDFGGGGFGGGFGGGGNPFQQPRYPQEDLSIVIEHHIPFVDIYNDTPQEVVYERFIQCPACDATGLDHNSNFTECKNCDGSGNDPNMGRGTKCNVCDGKGGAYEKKCPRCNGNKMVSRTERVTVNNVFSVVQTQTVSYRGMGHLSQYENGRQGDTVIHFIPSSLEGYTRQHANLLFKMPIHFQDAIDGANINYKHVNGKVVTIKLPKDSKNGSKLKLSGLGLLQPDKRSRGDLLIEVDVVIDYDRLNKEPSAE